MNDKLCGTGNIPSDFKPGIPSIHAPTPSFQKDCGVQTFKTRDPNPRIPFVRPKFPHMTKAEVFLYAVAWVAALGALALTWISK